MFCFVGWVLLLLGGGGVLFCFVLDWVFFFFSFFCLFEHGRHEEKITLKDFFEREGGILPLTMVQGCQLR